MSDTATRKRQPEDLCFANLAFAVNGPADEAAEGSVALAERTPRATAISNFAAEMGVDFTDVHCETAYARILTRQEVWDEVGRDRANDDLFDDDIYVHRYQQGENGQPSRFFIERHDTPGVEVPEDQLPTAPERVPDDWEPDEYDGQWERCQPDAPGATKVYLLSVREA